MASIQNLFTVDNLGYSLYVMFKRKCENCFNNGDMFKHLFTSRCAAKSSLFSKWNGLKFPPELFFCIMNAARDSYLLNSNVAFLKSGQNAAGICLFFYGASVNFGTFWI